MYKSVVSLILALAAVTVVADNGELFDFYPASAGCKWEYTDGSLYEITGQQVMTNGRLASRVKTFCGSCEWTDGEEFIYQRDNSLYISPNTDGEPSFVLLRFPVRTGDVWLNASNGDVLDTCYVVDDSEPVSVPGGSFANCVRIETRNHGTSYIEWFAPHVGLVKRVDVQEDKTVELKAFGG